MWMNLKWSIGPGFFQVWSGLLRNVADFLPFTKSHCSTHISQLFFTFARLATELTENVFVNVWTACKLSSFILEGLPQIETRNNSWSCDKSGFWSWLYLQFNLSVLPFQCHSQCPIDKKKKFNCECGECLLAVSSCSLSCLETDGNHDRQLKEVWQEGAILRVILYND